MRAMLASKPAGKRLCRFTDISPSGLLLYVTLILGCAVVLPLAGQSQTAPSQAPSTPATPAKQHKKTKAALVAVPAPPPPPTVAPSLLEQPAVPATVSASKNELTVKADNSSLTQILHQVASATGMRLDGLGGDERVFGSFGPGAPREVLTSLLNGTSYNVMMVGDLPNGAPRELLLSRRTTGAEPLPAANANQTHSDEDNPDDTGNSDDSDDTAPPMQYTPPSITPETPPPPDGLPPRAVPQMRNMQNQPPQ